MLEILGKRFFARANTRNARTVGTRYGRGKVRNTVPAPAPAGIVLGVNRSSQWMSGSPSLLPWEPVGARGSPYCKALRLLGSWELLD